MSEMSAEKKKEIEKYIIKSYFGGGKNVESLANGADVIKGTDDGRIPQLIVEVTYFGESGVVMIKWNIYGDSQQNSFAMHICREREIERNRCDSVDSSRCTSLEQEVKILSKALQEWKDGTGCPSPSEAKTMIECMASWHRAYDDAKTEIESLKKALRTSNSTMQKELEHEIDAWQIATGRIGPEEAKQYIDRLKGRLNKIHDYAVDW